MWAINLITFYEIFGGTKKGVFVGLVIEFAFQAFFHTHVNYPSVGAQSWSSGFLGFIWEITWIWLVYI